MAESRSRPDSSKREQGTDQISLCDLLACVGLPGKGILVLGGFFKFNIQEGKCDYW